MSYGVLPRKNVAWTYAEEVVASVELKARVFHACECCDRTFRPRDWYVRSLVKKADGSVRTVKSCGDPRYECWER